MGLVSTVKGGGSGLELRQIHIQVVVVIVALDIMIHTWWICPAPQC